MSHKRHDEVWRLSGCMELGNCEKEGRRICNRNEEVSLRDCQSTQDQVERCGIKSVDGAIIIYSSVQSAHVVGPRQGLWCCCQRRQLMQYDVLVKEYYVVIQLIVNRDACVSFVQVYAPTKYTHKKESDLNACIGCKCDLWVGVIGRHDEVEANDNGRRLLEFCMQ